MLLQDSPRALTIRLLLEKHVKRRLSEALSKIQDTDGTAEKKREKETEFFHLPSLIATGAACAGQIQMATHIVKAVHPDLKVSSSTNLNVDPRHLLAQQVVGSHVLQSDYQIDATGNGAYNKKIFEVFLLFREQFDGVTILDLLKCGDQDAIDALGGTAGERATWAAELSRMNEPRCKGPASSTLAKQLYWLTGEDPHNDASYHLLAPLYASSLAGRVYQMVRIERFSEAAKAAWQARKDGVFSDQPVHEYPQLAIQQLGGSKPQNISHLNSERRGDNLLLASLPPVWRTVEIKPLLNTASMFLRYGRRPAVRLLVKTLFAFLKSNPASTVETRLHRSELVEALIDEFLQLSAELGSLPPGWSQSAECQLNNAEKHWLDPDGAEQACADAGRPLPTDTNERISAGFANWLNAQLRDVLPMGDPEFLEWRKQMSEQIKAEEREGNHAD